MTAEFGFPYASTLGGPITLTYGGLSVTFTGNEFKGIPGLNGELERFGYTKFLDPNYVRNSSHTIYGKPKWEGAAFDRYNFEVSLKQITSDKVELLLAMYLLQQKSELPVRLHDQRIAQRAASPRERAKVADHTMSPAITGMEYFYAKHDVELIIEQNIDIKFSGRHTDNALDTTYQVTFGMKELDLVPTSEDKP